MEELRYLVLRGIAQLIFDGMQIRNTPYMNPNIRYDNVVLSINVLNLFSSNPFIILLIKF